MRTLLTVCFISFSLFLSGQIVNRNFEQVVLNNYGINVPVGWISNEDSTFQRVQSDMDALSGNYAVKLSPDSPTAWFDCSSYIYQSILSPDGFDEGDMVSFFSKSSKQQTDGTVYFEAALHFYKEGVYLGKEKYIEENEDDEYQFHIVPITQLEADSVILFFASGSQNGAADGCHNPTITYVDSVVIKADKLNSVVNKSYYNPTIFPNPAFGHITLQGDMSEVSSLAIYDLTGRMLANVDSKENSFKIEEKGLLVLQIKYRDNSVGYVKFVNQ